MPLFSYWPLVATVVVIVIGRLISITNSVPAGSIAERCLLSQCVTVTVAPIAPPMSKPLPPSASPPTSIPPPVPRPISVRSLPSWPSPLNWPSWLTSLPWRALVSTSVALSMNLSPLGRTRCSGKMAIVGLPAMRRGSLALVTRPSTVVPIGITVLPSNRTGSVTRAEKGSPAFELNVARVVSSFILTAVPAGKAACAEAKLASRISDVSDSVFLMFSFTSRIHLLSFFAPLGQHHPARHGRVGYRRDRYSESLRWRLYLDRSRAWRDARYRWHRCRARDEARRLWLQRDPR